MWAREEGSRDVYAEDRLFELMCHHQRNRIPGARSFQHGRNGYDVLDLFGEQAPTCIVFKNGVAYAAVQRFGSDLEINGAIHVGAEIVNEKLVRRVLMEAA